uniref:Uncharacterized protein n=1 Tax=Alexandrium monilatum TaxID=311494 RepID=A0A7S4PTX1_9DINO
MEEPPRKRRCPSSHVAATVARPGNGLDEAQSSPLQGRHADEATSILESAVAQRSSRALRAALAVAQVAGVKQARVQRAELLLGRLEAAEAVALRALSAARRTGGLHRLVVLDFDRTISKEHMWATFQDAPLQTVPVGADTFVDLEALKLFVSAARENGHGLAVATFGRRDVAGKALSFALGDDHGIHITTPADFADPSCSPPGDDVDKSVPRCPEGCAYLGSKNRQLAALADKFGVCASQMILLDDDAHNVREALRAGVMAQHTPMGLTKAVLSKVGKTIGLPASLFMPPCAL